MNILNKFKNFLNNFEKNYEKNYEKILITSSIFIFLIIHSIVSLFHFHECDSSEVYKYLTDKSIFSSGHFLGHIWKTGFIFTPLRVLFALIISIIPFYFIKSLILFPLKMTYPPLAGWIYGLYLPNSFGSFYEYASFVNIIFMIICILLFYNALKFVGISKYIAFICSFGLLGLYSVNSYTYHLGSTIWFICGSLISISSTIFFHDKKSKYGFSFALITSYPAIIHFFAHNIYLYFYRVSKFKFFSNNFPKKILIDKIFLIFQSNKIGFVTLILIICFFLPFNSGNRLNFDYRGFFTPFALLPQYSQISFFTIVFSIILFLLFIYTLWMRILNKVDISNSYKKFKSLQFAIDVSIINLLLTFFLIFFEKLSFGLTRHSLFILPYIFFLVAIALQIIFLKFRNIFFQFGSLQNAISISLFTTLLITSTYSSYLRFDPLKTEEIPLRIREFVSNNETNTMSLIDCDFHYLYNDFTKVRASYNKKNPSTYVPLDFLGKRLLVTQSIREIDNFSLDLKKGDELITKNKNVKIVLMENPHFKETQVYFDSMNFDLNSSLYKDRNNPYSRSNSVYIFPIKVISLDKDL